MKKNKRQAEDKLMEEASDEEPAMNVENDGALDNESEGDEDDDEPVNAPHSTNNDGTNAFFDSFYGLSSSDPRERSQAAKEMLMHCLIGPSANVKDASYALKRLLNGICSGRAAARQGNASGLAMFLKVALAQGTLKEIQSNSTDAEEKQMTLLAFVRHKLLLATEPSVGTRKGSEDRDYKFGRLFGILGVVKSGVLLPVADDHAELSDILEVATGFVDDLVELYAYKKWMREPVAHAIGTILSSFYNIALEVPAAQTIVDQLVKDVIVPKLLTASDQADGGSTSKTAVFSAEQAAMAIHIQAHASIHSEMVLKSLDLPVLTPHTVQTMAAALAETSSVTYPRIHLFWDAFIFYISEPTGASASVQERKLRTVCPVGDVSPIDLIQAVLKHVVIENLLGLRDGQEETKTTHERSALGLCIVRNLAGVEFSSSITGLTRMVLDPETMEHVVLQPQIVKHLFSKVLCHGVGGRKNQSTHLLRPLALQTLESLAGSIDDDDDATARKLAIVRPLLRCDSRFDASTKSVIIDQMVVMKGDQVEVRPLLWSQYLKFLQSQLLKASSDEPKSTTAISPYEAYGYVDLIFNLGKTLLHSNADTKEKAEFKSATTRSLLLFLLAASSFDCREAKSSPPSSSKKKKTKKASKQSPVVEVACAIKTQLEGKSLPPYQLRCNLSSRFYSLVAEAVAASMHSKSDNKENEASELLSYLCDACRDLEAVAGAARLHSEDDSDHAAPRAILDAIYKETQDSKDSSSDIKAQRFVNACSILGSTLYLQLLDCGPVDNLEEEDIEADAENDAEEVGEYISGLHEVCSLVLKDRSKDNDPMVSMSDLCAGLLSSPIASGSESKSGFPRLLRDAVKMVWVSALTLRAGSKDKLPLQPGVYSILLRSIGAEAEGDAMDVDEEESDEDASESDAGTVGESDDSGDVFSRAAMLDEVERGKGNQERQISDDDDGSEVGINPDRLRSFLEEDSDADVDATELEHHEGADAALAKLIQIKQEARKAGQLARERTEMSRQLRCLILLETLLNGKPDGWGALVRAEHVLPMMFPLLRYRKELENSLAKAAGKLDEKRSMAEKITSLLKTKLFKMKHIDRQWIDPSSSGDICATLAANILDLMKGKVSKEQRSCCSLALTAVIRFIPESPTRIFVGSIYKDIVEEWSTRRTTRLESHIIEDFILICPIVAQATLCAPLASVVASARSSYLRTESARLLSLLYNANLNPRNTELENEAFDLLCDSLGPSLEAFAASLEDPETKKSKRGKELLKALAKVLTFTAATTTALSPKLLHNVKKHIEQLKNETESLPLEDACSKLLTQLEQLEKVPCKASQSTTVVTELNPAEDDSGSDGDAGAGKVPKKKQEKKKKQAKKISKKKRR
ncbi:hypothetical protein MPSEU_000953000 [Mayamaea pseudoterrestris]|nr:hypothetical protein MPSEU_000953000 [Mayamaea pseudoterrestris]